MSMSISLPFCIDRRRRRNNFTILLTRPNSDRRSSHRMESNAGESRNWLELPPEVTSIILQKIGVIDILYNARGVCTSWHAICHDPSMWRSIVLKFDPSCNSSVNFEKLATYAVDRSCGQLVDITVAYVATDDFIRYLAKSSPKLRRLQILYCHRLSDDVLKETASKFPMLEELKVQSTPLSLGAVEVIGSSCPRLKIFKCNSLGYAPYQAQDDELANIIAHGMPHLCHLQLLRTKITNFGLKAILNGCPHLETLDMRGCNNIEPKVENLAAVCSARFNKVRFPPEPIEPDEFEDVEEPLWSDIDDDSFSDFGFFGHLDDPMFDVDYDDVDYDVIFDYEDDEVDDDEVGEFYNEDEGEGDLDTGIAVLEEELEFEVEEAAMRMAELEEELELEVDMRIMEEEEEELESDMEDDELEFNEDDESELEDDK